MKRQRTALAVLGVGAAACGTILGDIPDGHLNEASSDAGTSSDVGLSSDVGTVTSDGLGGTICSASNASIIDMAIDATDVFWLSVKRGGGAFTLEKCSKGGGPPSTMATLSVEPRALVLSKDYALWSVDRARNESGGLWRIPKGGGTPPSEPWASLDHAGALAFAADTGRVYIGMPAGNIEIYVPDNDVGRWGTLAPSFPPPGSIPSIFVSDTTLYWSRKAPSDIVTVPSHAIHVNGPDPFAGAHPTTPSFLWFDNGSLYWAVVTPSGARIYTQRGANSQATFVTDASAGFTSLAVRDGIFWAATEGGVGVVRHCAENAPCPADAKPFWQGNARVSHLAVDDSDVYFAAGDGVDTHIVRRKKP
ncbi:hypothetical protein LZC95_51740 [Pendulispora brunnea]|uniref:Uncharacterized protein n=1 Tax=Pendulispora brunnea TaxID=2905690 RepID=A0ABZ2KDE3_9BACT